jgi:ABC-type glycerol-3-phosphate transport system substrate-binding protein
MQQLFLQGKAATTFNGTWLLPQLLAARRQAFDLHVAPPPRRMGRRDLTDLAWTGLRCRRSRAEPRQRVRVPATCE